MDQKTVAKLRGWMRKYGHSGTLMAGGYLVLHHIHTKRRTALILSAVSVVSLGTLLLRPQLPQAVRTVTPPASLSHAVPTAPAADLNADLLDAVRHDDLPRVKATLDAGADADASDTIEYYTLLTRHEADYNVPLSQITGDTALGIAVQHKNIPIVRLLLEHWPSAGGPENSGIDANLVAQASADGSNEIVRLLLTHKAPMDGYYGEGLTPLKAAADHHHLDTIDMLLAHGVDVNEDRGAEGTALAYIAEKGDLPMVKFLVTRGAHINDRSQHSTVLQDAVEHPEVVRYLLHHGADVNQSAKGDWTPLIAAARFGHTTTVKILLDHGANINSCSTHDGTALTIAASAGHTDTVKTLLQRGADFTLSSTDANDTALEAAQENHHPDIVRLLQQAGVRE